jgi:hypothetical protein
MVDPAVMNKALGRKGTGNKKGKAVANVQEAMRIIKQVAWLVQYHATPAVNNILTTQVQRVGVFLG